MDFHIDSHQENLSSYVPTENSIKQTNSGDDDNSEDDFVLLQMPLVPKKFIVKQEIKTEVDDIKYEVCYPEDDDIVEEEYEEFEVDADENTVDNDEVVNQDKEQQVDTRKTELEKQRAEIEQKIKDVKLYYSTISSMCSKLDSFISSVDGKLTHAKQLHRDYLKAVKKIPDVANTKCSGWTHVFGAPYFKDKQFFFPPKNYDSLQKEQRREINVNSLPLTHLWKPYEKQKVALAIKKFEVLKRIDVCKRRAKELASELHNMDKETRIDAENEIKDLAERQTLLEQLSLAELVHETYNEYDWLKISVTDLCSQHSPEECRSMWFAYLHPDINKGEWTSEEKEMLKDIAEEHNHENWAEIAEQLGTGRSEFQCIRFYQMNLNDQLTRRKWTEEEDQLVQQMVERYRVGTFIPWARVTANIEGRTKVQVFNRWKYCLEPSIKKGRFTEEEDLMILAGMKWYGKNFQQISRFIPGRTPVQLRDRYNASLERSDSSVWDESCDEKLVEMVEEVGQSSWAYISNSFPGFSRVQVRHRYVVIEKWRALNGNYSFPPLRQHSFNRNYDDKLREVMGSYFNITEQKGAIIGDKPLFQIQKQLGLRHRSRRAHRKFRMKRKKYVTALDALFLKHFSVSYHFHNSASKRVVDKEAIDDDAKVLKSLLTVFNAVLNIPGDEGIKRHFELRNHKDRRFLAYLRDGNLGSNKVTTIPDDGSVRNQTKIIAAKTQNESIGSGELEEQQEVNKSKESAAEITVAAKHNICVESKQFHKQREMSISIASPLDIAVIDPLTTLLPKKCNFSLAMYVKDKILANTSQNASTQSNESSSYISTGSPQVQKAASPACYKYKKGSAAKFLNAMLPRKCSYSLAESVTGKTGRATNSSVTSDPPLPSTSESSSAPSHSASDANVSEPDELHINRTHTIDADSHITSVEGVSDCYPIPCDSSVPIDNGITIRWCLIPNYATLVCCKTMLLCNAPLSRTVIKNTKRKKKLEKKRKEDRASTKLSLERKAKTDDSLDIQEMLAEFAVYPNEQESSSFTFAEADALCKQRFVSTLFFPALASIRNIKVPDDLFGLLTDKRKYKRQTGEETCSEEEDNVEPVFKSVNKSTVSYPKHNQQFSPKENLLAANIDSMTTGKEPESNEVSAEGKVKKKRGRKRKSESISVDRNATSVQTVVLSKRKYKRSSIMTPVRKSGRPPKPIPHDPHLLYS